MNPRRWPILTDADRAAVARVLDRGVLSGAGAPEAKALEAEFAAVVGRRFCLATNSGTSALHIALAAAGVGPGDEVIVPALSFIATAQAVLHQGAIPLFADVEPDTYNIDTADAARRATSRTRAIVPVHLHGLPADMDAIGALARHHGLTVVEDAAQAHGATYKGRAAGTLGAMAAFSLNSTKNLPAGRAGSSSRTPRSSTAERRARGSMASSRRRSGTRRIRSTTRPMLTRRSGAGCTCRAR